MADLSIALDDETLERFTAEADARGVSAEELARELIRQAAAQVPSDHSLLVELRARPDTFPHYPEA